MRARSRRRPAIALPLLAVALAGGACGGGTAGTQNGTRGEQLTSGEATGDTSRQRPMQAPPAWPHAEVLSRIAGEILQVDGRRVRVDRATVTCGGDGQALRRGRERRWESFTCIQPTFNGEGTAGPDVVFRVQPTGRTSFRITSQRVTRYWSGGSA
jgi:hypothetical protein